MKKILIIMGRYLPGYKDGGPVRSIKNLVDRLGDEYEFRILTTDRDHGDTQAYPEIRADGWNQVGAAKVYYVQPGGFNKATVSKLAQEADLVYLCGCFNDYARTALALKKEGRIRCRVVIAAMGLFSPGAFHIKYLKKKTYMTLLGALGYFRQAEWSATSLEEAKDIRREAGEQALCHLAEDLPRRVLPAIHEKSSEEGSLRVIFLSRISRKKNLTCAVEILQKAVSKAAMQEQKIHIDFDIYGNQEDPDYWKECLGMLEQLPPEIDWNYCGIADAEQIVPVFSGYDIFLFPTIGENYGHVIFEAMSGGCIPVISDQTPWTEEKMQGLGNVAKLQETDRFADTILKYASMNKKELEKKAADCVNFALQYSAEEAEDSYRRIFERIGKD